MKINLAHLRERARSGGWINFAVFDARSTSGSASDNSQLLAQLVAQARGNSLNVEQAALALKPLAGNMAYLLFAVGVIGTGLIAIPVLSGSISYIVTETFGWEQGLDKKFHQAKAFYIIMAISLLLGLSLNYIGITPIQSLIYTAILYGLTAPVLIAIILNI